MTRKEKIILIFILLLAFVLRFYKLGQNPPSLTWDETAIGYNAYSILKTGQDEHGRFLPIDYFTSFGDYKPPVSVYLTIPSVAIFGLNEFAVRFPSALFGTLTVLVVYFLVKELFLNNNLTSKNQKIKSSLSKISHLPHLTSLLLTISPWHILLSRAGFEANIATFFIVLGTYFFIKAVKHEPPNTRHPEFISGSEIPKQVRNDSRSTSNVKNKGWYLLLSAFCFLLSIYTFNTPRLFVPIFLLGLSIIYRKKLFQIKKWVLLSTFFGLIMIMPLIPHFLSVEGSLRFKEVNIFTNLEVVKTANQRIAAEENSFLARILYNRRIGYTLLFAKHYFDHFNLDYLFFHGDVNPKFSIQDTGQFYLIELPFLILGLFFLFKQKQKESWLILLWLLSGLIPAGTARETPHALRTLVTLPTWQIIITFGIFGVYKSLTGKRQKKAFVFMFSCFYVFMFLCFLHNYFIHYPKEFSREWQYGYKQAILYTKEIAEDYDEILVSNVYGRPYIYFLYYLQYSPLKYQQEAIREKSVYGQYTVKSFNKFKFGNLGGLISENKTGRVLLLGRSEEIPKKANILKEIKFLNGETAFVIAEK